MKLIYKDSESTIKPEEIEFTESTVYLRKNITSVEKVDLSGNKITYYNYLEAALTPEEFNQYSKQASAESVSNTLQLIEDQASGGTNQLTIMEALADLYDMVSGSTTK